MLANHDRRLGRLEERTAPKGRTVFIWNDYKPGTVEREIARRREAGTIGPHDKIVTFGWKRPD
jgi:hypothetical protein